MPFHYLPTLTIQTYPDGFAPVNAPMYFTFQSDFSTSTATVEDSQLIVDLQILDQRVEAAVAPIIDFPGRFKVPARANNIYVYNPAPILKSYVTFPFDSSTSFLYYVDENSGFGVTGPSIGYPGFVPETESIVRYQLHYGLETNPHFTFNNLLFNTGLTTSGTYSFFVNLGLGVNHFATVGDVIHITMDSDIYNYWNGTASILSIIDDGFATFITTDQIIGPAQYDQIIAAGGLMSGTIDRATHYYGTASTFYGYNGTKQFAEQDFSMGSRYVFTDSYKSFLTDFGSTWSNAIPIKPNQGERVRFFMDFYGDTPQAYLTGPTDPGAPIFGLFWQMKTYDSNRVLLNTRYWSLDFFDPATGVPWTEKSFTVCVFDGINSIPIVDGYYYEFSIIEQVTITIPSPVTRKDTLASIWYRGDTKCSKYDNVRLKFLNRQGSWQYWNFNKDTIHTTNIERTEYKRQLPYDYTLNTYAAAYATSKLRGTAILTSKVQEIFTINTDWISEEDFALLSQLFTSPEVYIRTALLPNNSFPANIPIIITDSSYVWKTRQRDKLFNLTISYKYAFDTNIQNQ